MPALALDSSQKPLQIDLLNLYDEFAEFDSYCAFFCDAVAALSRDKDGFLDETSAEGLRFFSEWLKERSAVLKGELESAWRASSE